MSNYSPPIDTLGAASVREARQTLECYLREWQAQHPNTRAGKLGNLAPLGYATHLLQDNLGIHVVHHNTKIVSYTDNGLRLDNGGYYSRTTSDRMHRFTPSPLAYCIRDFQPFVMWAGNEVAPFADGTYLIDYRMMQQT